MTQWTEWHGGEKPEGVSGNWLAVKLRDGRVDDEFPHDYYYGRFRDMWKHTGGKNDIVAYRVVDHV
jgi:hypothetical protein